MLHKTKNWCARFANYRSASKPGVISAWHLANLHTAKPQEWSSTGFGDQTPDSPGEIKLNACIQVLPHAENPEIVKQFMSLYSTIANLPRCLKPGVISAMLAPFAEDSASKTAHKWYGEVRCGMICCVGEYQTVQQLNR